MTKQTIRGRIKEGISFIPEDRLHLGLVPGLNMTDNVILKAYDSRRYSSHGLLNHKQMEADTEDYIKTYDIKNGGMELPCGADVRKAISRSSLIAREICPASRR